MTIVKTCIYDAYYYIFSLVSLWQINSLMYTVCSGFDAGFVHVCTDRPINLNSAYSWQL